eukprot:361422-Chlamydomonas_euryale.AAC.2
MARSADKQHNGSSKRGAGLRGEKSVAEGGDECSPTKRTRTGTDEQRDKQPHSCEPCTHASGGWVTVGIPEGGRV